MSDEARSRAVIASVDAQGSLKFNVKFDVDELSCSYVMAIKKGDLVLCATEYEEAAKKLFETADLTILSGAFWDGALSWDDETLTSDNLLPFTVRGKFAFQLNDREFWLDCDDLNGPIESIVIARATDGDSPKIFGISSALDGELYDCEEDTDFEEFYG